MRVKLYLHEYARELAALETEGWDLVRRAPAEQSVELVVSAEQLGRLAARGYATEVLEIGRPLSQRPRGTVPPGYGDLTSFLGRAEALCGDYAGLCRWVDLNAELQASTTWEGRSIHALKISDNVELDEDEPTALFVAGHHAREITTPEAALDVADTLLSNYGGATSDYVDRNEIWVVPIANPDGYDRVWTQDNLWRKNVRDTCAGAGDGVDLNRNYPKDWAGSCQGSDLGCMETYRGPSAASEPEVQTIQALNLRERFVVSLDYHSFGEDVLWGYFGGGTCPQVDPSQQPPILETRDALQAAIDFSERGPSAGGEHFEWQYQALGVLAYLLEINSSSQGFQPPYADVPAIVAGVRPAIAVILDRIEGAQVRGHVVDGRTGEPLAAELTITEINLSGGELRASDPRTGRYQWLLTTGTYQLQANAAGYQPFSQAVAVVSGTPTELLIVLDPLVVPFRAVTGGASGGGSRVRRLGPGA